MSSIKIFFSLLLSLSLCTNFTFSTTKEKVEYVYLCEGPYSRIEARSAGCRCIWRPPSGDQRYYLD
jgi:hypothetical protein